MSFGRDSIKFPLPSMIVKDCIVLSCQLLSVIVKKKHEPDIRRKGCNLVVIEKELFHLRPLGDIIGQTGDGIVADIQFHQVLEIRDFKRKNLDMVETDIQSFQGFEILDFYWNRSGFQLVSTEVKVLQVYEKPN